MVEERVVRVEGNQGCDHLIGLIWNDGHCDVSFTSAIKYMSENSKKEKKNKQCRI